VPPEKNGPSADGFTSTDYQTQTEAILEMGIEVIGLIADCLKSSHPYRHRNGLSVNDSLIAGAMETEGIGDIATANPDFTRVEGLHVYVPLDLPKKQLR